MVGSKDRGRMLKIKGSRIMSTLTGGGFCMRVALVVKKSAAARTSRKRTEDRRSPEPWDLGVSLAGWRAVEYSHNEVMSSGVPNTVGSSWVRRVKEVGCCIRLVFNLNMQREALTV